METVTKKADEAIAEAKASKQEAAAKGNPAAAEKQQEKYAAAVYVGPPVKGTILHNTFTIFADGIPKEYRQHPIFKHLFVSPERLDQARNEIGRTGSLRNTYYKRAVEETTKKASEK